MMYACTSLTLRRDNEELDDSIETYSPGDFYSNGVGFVGPGSESGSYRPTSGMTDRDREDSGLDGTIADLRKQIERATRSNSRVGGGRHHSSHSSGLDDTMGQIEAQIAERQQRQHRRNRSRADSRASEAANEHDESPLPRVCSRGYVVSVLL